MTPAPRYLAIALLLGLAFGCDRGRGVATLDVSPAAGPPGTILGVDGLGLAGLDPAELDVLIGGHTAPFAVDGARLYVAVPLRLGADGWAAPVTEAQRLEVRSGGRVVGRSRDAIAVTSLPEAPGTTRELAEAFGRASMALEALVSSLPVASPQEAHAREAVFRLLHDLTLGEGSLLALVEGRHALVSAGGSVADVALLDALLATSGALAYAHALERALADAMRVAWPTQLLASADGVQHVVLGAGGLCRGGGDDVGLACRMQVQSLLADFTDAFVRPTAGTYANTVGLAAGVAAIAVSGGAAIPLAAIAGTILGVMDFAMSKLVPALLPSRVHEWRLEVLDRVVDLGTDTTSTITVTAVNQPPGISLLEVVEQVYGILGLSRPGQVKVAGSLDEVLRNAVGFVLGQYGRILRALDGPTPRTFGDDLRLPLLTWGPVEVTTDDLVSLSSYDEAIVAAREERLEWEGVDLGEATVRATPRGPGERSRILRDGALCPGCSYSGGAFGTDAPAATERIAVGRLDLVATPDLGPAPLTTTFSWEGLPAGSDRTFACTLDPGDGSPVVAIADCGATTTHTHTYAHASSVRTESGSYLPVLAITGTSRAAVADVRAVWSLRAAPDAGTEPLEATFVWQGFHPDEPVTCQFVPGDGGAARTIEDCHRTTTTSHRYTTSGRHEATIVATGPLARDVRSSTVTVRAEDDVCEFAHTVDAWDVHVTMAFDGGSVERGTGHRIEVSRSADVHAVLEGPRIDTTRVTWNARVDSGVGTARVDDSKEGSTRTRRIHGSGPPSRVTGNLTLRLEDCGVSHLRLAVSVAAINEDTNGLELPATVGVVQVHDVGLSGTVTLPVFGLSVAPAIGEDAFRLIQGAQYVENYGGDLTMPYTTWPEGATTASVTWRLTPRTGSPPGSDPPGR